ncbi:Hypothetical predicted protein, partial [Paramuricea clavata]
MEDESVGSFTALSSCLIHFRGKTGDLCKLTCHTLVKIKEYCEKWINLDGEPKEIAEKIIDVVRSWPDNEPDVLPTEAADFRYHKECYVRVPELACDHEEADTRMLLHASHATRYINVLVRSPDTDVFVLLLHFSLTISAKLYFLTGVKDCTRILDMEYIAQQLGAEKCKALIGFHFFTGCDSTSSFYGYSKVFSWNILLHDPTSVATLTSLGTEFSFDEQFEKEIEATVCKLYKAKSETSVNVLRYNMFRLANFLILLCHQTKIAFLNMSKEPITKQQFGSDLHAPVLMLQAQLIT